MASRNTSGANSEIAGTALIIWTKDGDGANHGFLNGGDSGSVTLDDISATLNRNSSTTGNNTDVRWVIRLGSQFYASDPFQLGGAGVKTLADPSATNWVSYDPVGDITSLGAAANLTSFDDLTAVGLRLDAALTQGSNIFNLPELASFAANGTVVPEPSIIALGCLGFGLALRRRR